MATSYNDVAVTTSWVDLTVANAALASVPIVIQNKQPGTIVNVFFGGASAPAKDSEGVELRYGEFTDGTAAKVWVIADLPSAVYTALKDA
jgi:hypothetical protein